VVYFGPIILLAMFLWKPVCRLIHQDGIGLTLCAFVLLGQSLCSESRGMINLSTALSPADLDEVGLAYERACAAVRSSA